MSTHCTLRAADACPRAGANPLHQIGCRLSAALAVIGKSVMTLLARRMEARAMRELARLDDRLLRDVGLIRRTDGSLTPLPETERGGSRGR